MESKAKASKNAQNKSSKKSRYKVNSKKFKHSRILMLNYEFPPLGGGASPVSYEIAKGIFFISGIYEI